MMIILGVVVFALLVLVSYLASRLDKVSTQINSYTEDKPGQPSIVDNVTGLYNRGHLLRRLQETMARADRDKGSISLILWDLEGFVDFNNEHGQKEGNRLLRQVAEAIKKSVRVYDEVFRTGPDEFSAILVPGDNEIAKEVTRRVSELVSKSLFEGDAEYAGKSFAVSSGFVFYPNDNERSVEALLHAANQALYKSRLVLSEK
jgi:diguanylate cyclase (GGDEF)-like protein